MGATTVSGTILGVDNAPRVGVYLYFRLKTTGTDSVATSTIDATRISAVTDANGQFSTTLWDNGDSGVTSIMEIQMPSGQRHEVIIPAADAAIDVWDLIENYTVGTADPQLPTNEALFLKVANNLSDVASPSTSRTNLGVAIGSHVQAWSAVLDATTASFLIADETKLDGIEALADVTDTANVTAAGALMDSELASVAAVKATTASFLIADEAKLDGIEALADVTDATNVAAAGGYVAGGTDVAIADGGTGASTASAALVSLGIVNGSGGGQIGTSASATFGGAVGNFAIATEGGAVGDSAVTTTGGAVGAGAVATSGGAVGSNANATDGGAVGFGANSTTGGAVGISATATDGGAVGADTNSTSGGAVGADATATDGFAGGNSALANGTGRVQLGTGTNSTDSTIQFLSSGSVTATQFGKLAATTTSVTSTTYTALATDAVILVDDDTAAATVTITLLAAATAGDGFTLTVKKLGTTADVIIDADGTETIDDSLTNTIKLHHDWRKLVSDGSNWHIIG